MRSVLKMFCLGLLLAPFAAMPLCAQESSPRDSLAHDIFKQLIEINTTDSVGNVTTAAEAMAQRLRDGGFAAEDVVVAGPNERKKNLVVRLRGSGKRQPILFIGHLDVVEARREDWTTDPFKLVEKDGFFYGRGSGDMKEGDAMLVANFIRLRQEHYVPDRDLILALTADEEGGGFNGIDWLVKEHRDWIGAEYCINLDGGEFDKKDGKKLRAAIQTSEKVYADFTFESLNPGGHSSLPSPDNAIYHLAEALTRLQNFAFPAKTDETTRKYFQESAKQASGPLATDLNALGTDTGGRPPNARAVERLSRDPYYNSLLRTTCVATMLSGGHAPNALPQTARANVNCRIFPGEDPEQVHQTLIRVAADAKVTVNFVEQKAADGSVVPVVNVPASPLLPEVTRAMDETLAATWPGVPWVPQMSTGASDGKILRIAGIPTYGISCMFYEVGENRAHGKDERIGVQDFYDGVEFNYRLLRALSSSK
jgi:acetylornithine deacetylase/succinyl-diaminopimelate desuccinylase-like protein